MRDLPRTVSQTPQGCRYEEVTPATQRAVRNEVCPLGFPSFVAGLPVASSPPLSEKPPSPGGISCPAPLDDSAPMIKLCTEFGPKSLPIPPKRVQHQQEAFPPMSMKLIKLIAIIGCVSLFDFPCVFAGSYISDGGFEGQAAAQSLLWYQTGPNGGKWGRAWNGDWSPAGLESSWRAIESTGSSWVGGSIARTEDFATGWKWARTGDVFGIIKDHQTMSLTFTATANNSATLNWYDAARNSWRGDTWFGRENNYSVTVTDDLNNVHTIANETSKLFSGSDANSWINASDDRFTLAGKQGWFSKTSSTFYLTAGRTYTLSFNSLSPTYFDANGNLKVDDRTTLLDDISMTLSAPPPIPEPTTMAIFGLGGLGLAFLRRRR